MVHFQTVGWWIEQLSQYPKDTPVFVATEPLGPHKLFLSEYMVGKYLIIDVGNEDD